MKAAIRTVGAGVVLALSLRARGAAAVPVLSLSASCTPDAQGKFTITNIGSNMTGPGTWTMLLNGTPIASNTFQLNASASTSINTSGLFGTLELDAGGGGAAPATASTFCQSPPPPTLSLSASCTPDAQGRFTIKNIGSNMTGPGTWTMLLNGTPIASNNFQLNAGVSTSVNTSGLFGTLELDAGGGGAAPVTASTFCQSPGSARFHTVPPCRVVDTRNATGPLDGPALQPSQVRLFTVVDACGIPPTAVAVSVNATVVPAAGGYLALYPGNDPNPPGTSNLNFAAGKVRANNAVVLLSTDGSGGVNVQNHSTGTTHFILDVNGYFE